MCLAAGKLKRDVPGMCQQEVEKLLQGTGAAALQTRMSASINEHKDMGSWPTAGAAAGLGHAEQQELLSK